MPNTALQNPYLRVALGTALLLLLPAVAMQFTSEVSWGPGDFVVAGVLLAGAGSILVAGLRRVDGAGRKAAFVFGVIVIFALVWAELAVGLLT